MMDALVFGVTTLAQVYLLRMGNGVASRKQGGSSPTLLELSIKGDLNAITAILNALSKDEAAALVHQQDAANGQNAAIHGAVFAGHLAVVEYLVSKGSGSNSNCLNLRNGLGCTPLWLAAGYNHPTILDFLLNMAQSEVDKAEMLLASNTTGDTPLIAAASKGHVDICRRLTEVATEISQSTGSNHVLKSLRCATNQSNDTALSVALGAGAIENVDVLTLLCDASILDVVNSQGLTPLLIACERDLPTVVQTLMDLGANALVKDASGHSIVAVAAFCGSTHVLDLLLHGTVPSSSSTTIALLNGTSEASNCTPLWLATRAGHTSCVQRLLTAGADKNIANRQGLTPLQVAQKYNRTDLVELLQ